MIPVRNLALVLGVAVVRPLCLGGAWWGGGVLAAGSVVAALLAPDGVWAALLVAPWVGLVTWRLVDRAIARDALGVVNVGFGVVAALALVASRAQFTAFGIVEPIVKLTALHFSYAGVGTFWLARKLLEPAPSSTVRQVTVGLVGVAPVVVALGFLTRLATLQVGGAVLMTLGAWAVAALGLLEVRALPGWPRVLLVVSSSCPWGSMVLAVGWAMANSWPSVPALTVVDMVPTHGALNAFGFVGCGVVARTLASRRAQG